MELGKATLGEIAGELERRAVQYRIALHSDSTAAPLLDFFDLLWLDRLERVADELEALGKRGDHYGCE